jgi:hypothetical protein
MAISINNFNSLNKTISNNKVMKFKGCVAEIATSANSGNPYEVFKVELQRDGAEYLTTLRFFVPKAEASDGAVNIFMRSINQFAIAAMGKDEFQKAITEAMGTKVLSNLEYAVLVADLVRKNTKVGQEVELFQVYCYKNGTGKYFGWNKKDGFTLNRAPVNESEIEFDGANGDMIYRSVPKDITYTGTFYRFSGDDTIEFVESPTAAAFREVAQRRMDAAKNAASTESTTTAEDNDVFPSDW